MIRGRGDREDGKPSFVFGLSAENVKRLKQGSPIHFDLNTVGGEGDVTIFYGETEEEMIKVLRKADLFADDMAVKMESEP